jgi:hypothetical protein
MSTRLIRTAVAPLLVAGGLALAQPALATDYCVAPNTTCGGVNVQSFQAALDAAAQNAGPDRVFLGAATYTAPSQGFIYDPMNSDDPVEVAGAGNPATVLQGTSGAYRTLAVFGGSDTSIHDLRIVMPPNALSGAQAFRTNGTARNVSVTEVVAQQKNDRTGVVLLGSGAFEQGFVGLDTEDATTGIVLSGGGSISDSTSYAGTSVATGGGTIERSVLGARQAGVAIAHGSTAITSTRIATYESGSVGLPGEQIDGDAAVQMDGVTMIGPYNATNGGSAVSLDNAYTPALSVDVALKNTLIRGYANNFWVGADDMGSGHVHLDASYSDYDSSLEDVVGSKASVTESHISFAGDAPFGEEDLVPMAGSALIDAGDPTEPQGKDLRGNPLVTDGDGDGVARRDIGAVELPTQPLKSVPADASPAGGNGQPPALPPVDPARDTLAPALSGLRFSHKVFAVGRARTAIAARTARGTRLTYTLSESAKVVVKIQRVGAKRAAGKLTRTARSGRNTVAFSGRIGAKALKAGRYRALITATDASGNRSAAKSVSFRIVKR